MDEALIANSKEVSICVPRPLLELCLSLLSDPNGGINTSLLDAHYEKDVVLAVDQLRAHLG